MARHITYRGVAIDMDSLSRENEKVPAIGNMRVNAKGDQISGGKVTKTADQIARDNHRVQQAVVNTGLKGKQPVAPSPVFEAPKATPVKTTAGASATAASAQPAPKMVERELPSGDIVMEDTTKKE
jgi:hypothetical protein